MTNTIDQILTNLIFTSNSIFNNIELDTNDKDHYYEFSDAIESKVDEALEQLIKENLSLTDSKVYFFLTKLLMQNYNILLGRSKDINTLTHDIAIHIKQVSDKIQGKVR